MAANQALRRLIELQSSYLTDTDICLDLNWSKMTLWRRRNRGEYPPAVKFTEDGPNRTPRAEHEAYKAAHEAAPRLPGRRPGSRQDQAGQRQLELTAIAVTSPIEATGAPGQSPAPRASTPKRR
jgi:hypothetical protein